MTDLDAVRRVAVGDRYLAVVATTRADGSVQASVVNAGISAHPLSGEQVVAFVTYGRIKLAHLRARRHATVTFRSGWQWATVEGPVDLAGPDDPLDGLDAEGMRLLLRQVFSDAGGTHDDWETYDRVMAEQRRVVVLVHPQRMYGNA